MRKRIVFLSSEPEGLKKVISKIQKVSGAEVIVLHFKMSHWRDPNEIQKLSKKLKAEVIPVNFLSFENVIDKLYEEKNTVFVFETVLGDYTEAVFSYRINISYAIYKKEKCKNINDQRIWFYTVAGKEDKARIDELFGNYVIEAKVSDKNSKYIELNLEGNKRFYEAIM